MNRETGLHLAVALLAIGALGVSATTFESTVRTDADDVIDLDYDVVPIGQDDAAAIVREMRAADGDDADGGATSPDDAAGAESSAETSGDAGQPDEASAPDRSAAEDRDQSAAEERNTERSQSSAGRDDRAGRTPEEPSLLDRLLALLADLARYLLLLAALAVLAGLAVRYRDRLSAALGGPNTPADGRSAAAGDWLDGPPSNAVDRAWVGMVNRLDLDRPAAMTPGECAAAAIEAGFDREAVRSLTEAFREVQYGGRPVTDRHEEIAARSRRRLDTEEGA